VPPLGTPMQVDDVSNVVPDVAPNVVPGVAANVVPNVAPNVVPGVAPNVVPNVAPIVTNVVPNVPVLAPNIVANVAPNVVPDIAPNLHPALWPVETDLVFVSGTTRMLLTIQRPLMRSVIQDTFERIRVNLLFNNAFPDAAVALSMTRASLIVAAESHVRASGIHRRLLNDEEYMTNMIRLVSHFTCI
jgi:hypothetical protein